MRSPAQLAQHNAAVWPSGLVTLLLFINMITTLKFAVLLLAHASCQGLQSNYIDEVEVEEAERVVQASKYGSLWPLPQKVQISQVSFKLTSSSFRIVDAKESSAGPSCSILQDAYRR